MRFNSHEKDTLRIQLEIVFSLRFSAYYRYSIEYCELYKNSIILLNVWSFSIFKETPRPLELFMRISLNGIHSRKS